MTGIVRGRRRDGIEGAAVRIAKRGFLGPELSLFLEESNLAVEPRIDNVGDDHESDVENAKEDCLNGSQLRRNNLCRQLSLCFF